MDEKLIDSILDYLLAKVNTPLSHQISHILELLSYAKDHDHLGWQKFLEDRFSKCLFKLQQDYLSPTESQLHIHTCSVNLMMHILSITQTVDI